MSLEYWFLLPISLVIATVAMASGVEGATFFAPLFLLGLGQPPEVAIGAGLITEVFGFASGLTAYVRRKLIDYRLAGSLLLVAVPMALLGTWLSGRADPVALEAILGAGLFAVAFTFLHAPRPTELWLLDSEIEREAEEEGAESCVRPHGAEPVCYSVCNRTEGMLISGLGAAFMGLISTGLGEMNGYFLLRRCKVPSRVAVATSVLVVAVTALTAATGHLVRLARMGGDTFGTIGDLVLFTIPGVVVGGQIGPAVAARLPQHALERLLGVLFALVGALMLGKAIL